jgi:hypothetical protein
MNRLRAASVFLAALSLSGCDGDAQQARRANWAQECTKSGNSPADCVDAATRLYSSDEGTHP